MPASKKELLVTIDDDYVDKAATVVASLKKAGLTGVTLLEETGIVTGSAAPSKIAALRKVAGVRAVEESARIQLAPPDAPVQ
jgi:hypothetical protein